MFWKWEWIKGLFVWNFKGKENRKYLLYLKIASYYGFDLEIESDIVPKELIDSTPAKEYPEPYEFMKKFDLKTITPEEWKAWIYEYYPKPEELKEFEERGYFV